MDHAPALDLRRNTGRDLSELLGLRSRWLRAEDAELIRLHFGEGLTAVSLARLRGEPPRGVRTRLRRLAERLLSPRFEGVMRQQGPWPRRRRAVAGAVILQGLSFRDAALRLHLTLHQVRREMAVIEALVAEEQAGAVARHHAGCWGSEIVPNGLSAVSSHEEAAA